jgi:hypothetical protein
MKWLLWVGGGLILFVGLVAMIGAMLPLRHSASRKARYHAPPETVYAAIAGPPTWRSDVKAYGELAEQSGRKRWWEEDSQKQKITYELVEDRPPDRRVTRIADKNLPFGGTWTLEIAAAPGGGSELRIREDGEIYNVIYRFVARFFIGYTSTMETYLRDLGSKLGETVQVEA